MRHLLIAIAILAAAGTACDADNPPPVHMPLLEAAQTRESLAVLRENQLRRQIALRQLAEEDRPHVERLRKIAADWRLDLDAIARGESSVDEDGTIHRPSPAPSPPPRPVASLRTR